MKKIFITKKHPSCLHWTITLPSGRQQWYRWSRGRRFGDGTHKPTPVYMDVGHKWVVIPNTYFTRMSDVLKWATPKKPSSRLKTEQYEQTTLDI